MVIARGDEVKKGRGHNFNVTLEFIDKHTGEILGSDVNTVIEKLSVERRIEFKRLCLEASLGKLYKMAK